MGTGAFRDASAALERAAALAEENERLTERCRELEKALEESKDGEGDDRALRRLEKERDALATELEELRMEHIVNVERIRTEARQTQIGLNNRIYALEAECTALRDRLDLYPAFEEEPKPSEPPLLDDNSKAYLARVTEERDDLRRELRSLREAREAERERDRKTGGLLSRTLNRFLK